MLYYNFTNPPSKSTMSVLPTQVKVSRTQQLQVAAQIRGLGKGDEEGDDSETPKPKGKGKGKNKMKKPAAAGWYKSTPKK